MSELSKESIDFINKYEIKHSTDFCDTKLPTSAVKSKLIELESKLTKAQEEIERLNDELEQQIDNNLTDTKKAFWWSAEFTHVVHDGKINNAWEDYATRLVKGVKG